MRRTILLSAVVSPFVSAFLGGALAFSLVVAPQAAAQSSQLQEVRASAFTLVGPDGTVLASLAPAAAGPGRLVLHDAAGTQRLILSGAGAVNAYDQDGTTVVFRAGRTYNPVGAATGLPPLNGVELGPGGSVSTIPPLP